jgi:hypothetical protein
MKKSTVTKTQDIIKVYPKITVFCPKEKKEISGIVCSNGCQFFGGVKQNQGRIHFECKYAD